MKMVSNRRLYLLRAMYLLIVVGLAVATLPEIWANTGRFADSHTVVSSFLAGLAILSLLGLRYPLKMLPVLLFETVWKAFWLTVFAIPMYMNGGLDEYAMGVSFACTLGVILTPMVIPWRYVWNEYIRPAADVTTTGATTSPSIVTHDP